VACSGTLDRGLVGRRPLGNFRRQFRFFDARKDLVEIESRFFRASLDLARTSRILGVPGTGRHRGLVGVAGSHQIERDACSECKAEGDADEYTDECAAHARQACDRAPVVPDGRGVRRTKRGSAIHGAVNYVFVEVDYVLLRPITSC
jgi:hypothetical protein